MTTRAKQARKRITEAEILAKSKGTAGEPEPLERGKEMAIGLELVRGRKFKELWQRYCGWIDLSLEETMNVQRRLLMEQIGLLTKCEMGKAVMQGVRPRTVEEFRELVPLTTYSDYAPFLQKKRMDVLPRKPMLWAHTSGKSGEYDYKWVPLTSRQWEEMECFCFTAFCFATCKKRGEPNFKLHGKQLYGVAPPPYVTGIVCRYGVSEIVDFLPPIDEAETMSFEERFSKGFKLAFAEGLDYFWGLPSVMVAIGERFGQRGGKKDVKALLRQPKMLFRIMRGVIKSKLAGRPMLPKDVWKLKGLWCGGSDGSVYRKKIAEMWGRPPLDIYAASEAGMIISLQTWDCQDMVFYPHLNFFEFIPEEESLKSKADPEYKPRTLFLDEVRPGENYELVITNFHGGPFVRYRLGDLVKVTARRNEGLDIDIPQMVYHSRVDDMIDIAGFTRLTESDIWKALENADIPYQEWTARKELEDRPVLRVYVEPRGDDYPTAEEWAEAIHQQLIKVNTSYSELESYTGLRPLEVMFVPEGAFNQYMMKQQAAGAELGRMKVSHINPSDDVVNFLLSCPPQVAVGSQGERRQETVSSR